jgi:hypothetical protein
MYFGERRDISQVMTVGQVLEALKKYNEKTPLVIMANKYTPCGVLYDVVRSYAKDDNGEYISVVVLDVKT